MPDKLHSGVLRCLFSNPISVAFLLLYTTHLYDRIHDYVGEYYKLKHDGFLQDTAQHTVVSTCLKNIGHDGVETWVKHQLPTDKEVDIEHVLKGLIPTETHRREAYRSESES